jgi:L-ascorbate metabolism protein UlaG (beta-lactamase superfamily)
MKRRHLIRYAGTGVLTAIGIGTIDRWQFAQAQTSQAQTGGVTGSVTGSVTVRSLGHSCFQFTGDGRRILVNPFRPMGCTAGYRAPQIATDLVMVSSFLFDEGVIEGIPGNPRVLSEPGIYEFRQMQAQGIRTDHDRLGGRQFGTNVAWRWNQGGLNILHLGGAAAPITVEQKILMGRPDLLLIPVGGSDKAYTPQEAMQTVQMLNPKVIIPTQYRTQAADAATCEIQSVDEFLTLMQDMPIQQVGDSIAIRPSDLPASGSVIRVMSYPF